MAGYRVNFTLSIMPKPALGITKSHIKRVTRTKLTAHFNIVSREKIFRRVPPLPNTLHGVMLNYVQEQLNLPANAQQQLDAAQSILII